MSTAIEIKAGTGGSKLTQNPQHGYEVQIIEVIVFIKENKPQLLYQGFLLPPRRMMWIST